MEKAKKRAKISDFILLGATLILAIIFLILYYLH